MGYYVSYALHLRIKAANKAKALEIFNRLHRPDMVNTYGQGFTSSGTTIEYHYSWVRNPAKPYVSLTEAFTNWAIVEGDDVVMEEDEKDGDFSVRGSYKSKLGQQDFLLYHLAFVLCDTEIRATGENGAVIIWRLKDGKLHEFRVEPESPDEEVAVDTVAKYSFSMRAYREALLGRFNAAM